MNKSFAELIEEKYNSLTDEELWDFVLDASNYLKENKDKEYDETQFNYFKTSVRIISYCFKHKRISFNQFKTVNAFCRIIPITEVKYRQLV